MDKPAKKGQGLEELSELLLTVVERKRHTRHGEFTAEERARFDALLEREDVLQGLRKREDLVDLIFQVEERDDACVATCNAEDGSQEKLFGALSEANISPVMMVVMHGAGGVYVRRQDQARALNVIEVDARANRYWVVLWQEINPELRDTSG